MRPLRPSRLHACRKSASAAAWMTNCLAGYATTWKYVLVTGRASLQATPRWPRPCDRRPGAAGLEWQQVTSRANRRRMVDETVRRHRDAHRRGGRRRQRARRSQAIAGLLRQR